MLKTNKSVKKERKQKNMLPEKNTFFNLRFLLIVWTTVFMLLITAFLVMQFIPDFANSGTFDLMSIITSFSAFIVQSLFSFTVLRHNAVIRESNDELKKNSDAINMRAENFRTLQFVSANYTVVDFVSHMLMYDLYAQYKAKLISDKNFTFYLRETDVNVEDVIENPDGYKFATVRIPVSVVEGKAIGQIGIIRFKFVTESAEHRFVPCHSGGSTNSLLLHNESDKRAEMVVNLIMKKDSDVYRSNTLNPFLKIKINLIMQSLLGVAVTGWTELYFTNPERLESNGANKYKVNSSYFEVSGLPTLISGISEDI